MLIRHLAVAIALAATACADTMSTIPPDAPSAAGAPPPAARSRDDAFCDHRLYTCRPNTPGAQLICDEACLFPSHCQEYTTYEINYCAAHPDSFDPRYGYRYCDLRGNPTWDTHCVAGPRP